MFDSTPPRASRVACRSRIERARSSSCAMATKLYWPPTPLTTRPSSRASETAAPKSVIQHDPRAPGRAGDRSVGDVPLGRPVRARISEGADAQLQRAAVLHECGRVDADRVLSGLDRRVRHAEERMLVRRGVDDDVEE